MDSVDAVASLAVDKIINDLAGRLGLADEWSHIDADVQEEIMEEWESIVAAVMRDAVPQRGDP